jgi:hypothetical protein
MEAAVSSEVILPLDGWADAPQEDGTTPTTESDPSELEVTTDTSMPVQEVKPIVFPIKGAESVTLNKSQKKRLTKVEDRIRVVVQKEEQEKLEKLNHDPRGEKEIRICSANFNGYGTNEENDRLLKKVGKPKIAKAEKSILEAIVNAKCDVVSVQGIVGRSPSFAQEAMDVLTKKLGKRGDKCPWIGMVARSKEQSGYQGFLIKDLTNGPILGHRVLTFTDQIIRLPGEVQKTTYTSKNQLVPRDFMKLSLQVKSSDVEVPSLLSTDTKSTVKTSREIVLINGILAKGVAPFQSEDRLLKLQISEVAVKIFEQEQGRISPVEQPIVLLTIDRVEGVLGGVQQILTGRINLDDFEQGGMCKILSKADIAPKPAEESEDEDGEKKKKKPTTPSKIVDLTEDTIVSCGSKIDRPQLRFDLLASVPFEVQKSSPPEEEPVEGAKKKPKAPKRDLELQTTGIFLVSDDLRYTAKKSSNLLDSTAGRVKISNGLPGAYLVWADLNW